MREAKKSSEGQKAGARNTELVSSLLLSVKGVISFPIQSFPTGGVMGHRPRLNHIASAVHLSLIHCLSHHPHPQTLITPNGSSSQQTPAIMELCLNDQPCLSTSLFLPFFPSLNTHMHTLTSSHFHLQKAICTINTPVHSTLLNAFQYLGQKGCQLFRFRVFILYKRIEKNKYCRGSSHISECETFPLVVKEVILSSFDLYFHKKMLL